MALDGSPAFTPAGRRVAVSVAAVAAWGLLVGTVQVALVVPAEQPLFTTDGEVRFGYSGVPGTVSPLSDAYLARTLGRSLADPDPDRPRGSDADDPAVHGVPTSPEASHVPAVIEHEPTNDDVRNAYRVSSLPFTASTRASDASREDGEPDRCAPVGPTLWYRYTPDEPGVLIASTAGSEGVMALAVFAGQPSDATQRRCHTNALGHAQAVVPVVSGTTYHFQVAAVLQAPRPLDDQQVVFNLDPFGSTELISVTSGGDQRPHTTHAVPSISADGRYVAFASRSAFVDADTNDTWDVYVRDRETGRTELVSVSSDGTPGNGRSGARYSEISEDGRYVVFHSTASNLVEDDTNAWMDVFIHDRRTGETERVSVSSDGAQGEWRGSALPLIDRANCEGWESIPGDVRGYEFSSECAAWGASVSANGRFVAFESSLSGLSGTSTPQLADSQNVYLHDRHTGDTTLVSRTTQGQPAGRRSVFPHLSADGRYVVYQSLSDDIAGGRPDTYDVFVFDRLEGTNRLVSVNSRGVPAHDDSMRPRISSDGRWVTFQSFASNLVPDDVNEQPDAFVHGLATGVTTRASVTTSGDDFTGSVEREIAISRDGRYVVFSHDPPGSDEPEQAAQLYRRDRLTGTTTIMSVSRAGEVGRFGSRGAAITPDGRHIAFWSLADNLVEGDHNEQRQDSKLVCCGGDVFVHTFPVLR